MNSAVSARWRKGGARPSEAMGVPGTRGGAEGVGGGAVAARGRVGGRRAGRIVERSIARWAGSVLRVRCEGKREHPQPCGATTSPGAEKKREGVSPFFFFVSQLDPFFFVLKHLFPPATHLSRTAHTQHMRLGARPRAPPRLPGAARRVVAARASPSDAAPPPFPQGPATGPPREWWRRGLGGVVRVPRVVERRGGAGGEGGKEEGALDGIRSALFANEKTLTRPLFPPLFPTAPEDVLQIKHLRHALKPR